MGHIGDRHAQLKPLRGFLAPHGVIKIFGVLAIDGDKRDLAQIHPVGFICLGGLLTQRAGLPQHLIRPLPGNAVGANSDVNLQSRVEVIA